jgi:hypothetical protein|tara:strand:+ start:912 stop:1076 length:165 start_codon:yes stop_codon:yes gene_type:complete
LFFGYADRNGFKFVYPSDATELVAAAANSISQLGNVSVANLPQFNTAPVAEINT